LRKQDGFPVVLLMIALRYRALPWMLSKELVGREDVMAGRLDDAFRFNEAALSLRSQRQQVLATNIANADTPGFKARDFNFNAALQNVLERKGPEPVQLKGTASTHLSGSEELAPGGTPMLYRQPSQASIDGNTVEMDVERNQFMDNAVRYEASLNFVSGQIKNLLAAIQGGQ
jgi:flagellar basal-body rod protein FlgB